MINLLKKSLTDLTAITAITFLVAETTKDESHLAIEVEGTSKNIESLILRE